MTDTPSTIEKIPAWMSSASVHRKMAYALVVLAVVSGTATVATMTANTDVQTILNLLYVDGIILLLLGLVVARRLVLLWQERRSGQAGAGLHGRLVMLFGLVAVTPAILVAVFSALFINYALDAWFSDKVFDAINKSQAVTKAYLREHRKNISVDAFAIAGDLNFNAPLAGTDPRRFNQILSNHAALRALSEVLVIDRGGQIIARSELSLSLRAENIPKEIFDNASRGEIAIFRGRTEDSIRAIVRLRSFVDAFLLVERFVDPKVIEHIKLVNDAAGRYKAMEAQRGGIQVSFVMIFIVVSLLLLLAAIWVGLTVSTQMVRPISSLIRAAQRVSEGDLNVTVDATDATDEISTLGRTFNTMTRQLKSTQEGLMEANRELDERRRFTETVLAGVSAGVIGLDVQGKIHLTNRSASNLLETDLDQSIGQSLGDAIPEMAELLEKVMDRPERTQQAEIKVGRKGRFSTLVVSIAAERLAGDIIGYVVTFDDVTELFSAQRKAAWADVARRIAHEIKNPLTPIQLSAERLKRKYLGEIKSDPETFANCTDTIVRQVEDLHRMVDEFSSFARMPQLSLKNENLSEICRGVMSLETNRHPDIDYDADLPGDNIRLYCDHRQVSRALTNLFKNAAEAIIGRKEDQGDKAPQGIPKGEIHITLGTGPGKDKDGNFEENVVTLTIEDNGPGLPKEHREQLTEPYVTTRTKGTGLGLAIVKKIMEDHNGHLLLEDRDGGGARVSLVFYPMERRGGTGPDGEEEDLDPMTVATRLTTHGL